MLFAEYNPEPREDAPDRYHAGLTRVDFTVDDHGSVYILRPENADAREWMHAAFFEDVDPDDQPQTWCGGIVIEHGFLAGILDAIEDHGLTVDA